MDNFVQVRSRGVDITKYTGKARTACVKALRKGGNLVRSEARKNAPVSDRNKVSKKTGKLRKRGHLKRSYKVVAYLSTSATSVRIGSTDPVAHLVEKGTARRITQKGANRGAARAQPHLIPAFDRMAGKALDLIEEDIGRALDEGILR